MAVAFHLNKYLINNNFSESLESAYKSGHSTETAFLLDLFAAFDTVDHNVLFSRLKDMFSLSDKVLGFDPTWNNAPRKSLFMVFYLTFSFCYLVYNRLQLLVLCFLQCITVLLESLRSDMGLNITCMVMTHSCIYHWFLTMS